jgi:hypothetical protein
MTQNGDEAKAPSLWRMTREPIARTGGAFNEAAGKVARPGTGRRRSLISTQRRSGCISEATSRHSIILTADKSIYSCFGAAAQIYFNYLVSKNATQTVDKQRTATYIFREIPKIGRCWTKIENVDGVETATYGCSINVAGPPR